MKSIKIDIIGAVAFIHKEEKIIDFGKLQIILKEDRVMVVIGTMLAFQCS